MQVEDPPPDKVPVTCPGGHNWQATEDTGDQCPGMHSVQTVAPVSASELVSDPGVHIGQLVVEAREYWAAGHAVHDVHTVHTVHVVNIAHTVHSVHAVHTVHAVHPYGTAYVRPSLIRCCSASSQAHLQELPGNRD